MYDVVKAISVAAIAITACCALLPAGDSTLTTEEDLSEYFDVGDFQRMVGTDSPTAQLWFNRGLAMCYAFNHEEGFRCFEKAYAADPTCPMTLWGMAYALCPNINNLEIPAEQISRARMALQLAQLSSHDSDSIDRALISALEVRCQVSEAKDNAQRNQAYSDAMRKVYQQFPDDPDVAALFAESLMMLRPWKHWDHEGNAAVETPEIVRVLETAMENAPDHPALCHFYIHTMEISPTPEKALGAAN